MTCNPWVATNPRAARVHRPDDANDTTSSSPPHRVPGGHGSVVAADEGVVVEVEADEVIGSDFSADSNGTRRFALTDEEREGWRSSSNPSTWTGPEAWTTSSWRRSSAPCRSWTTTSRPPSPPSNVYKLFARSDDDGDGRLSDGEFGAALVAWSAEEWSDADEPRRAPAEAGTRRGKTRETRAEAKRATGGIEQKAGDRATRAPGCSARVLGSPSRSVGRTRRRQRGVRALRITDRRRSPAETRSRASPVAAGVRRFTSFATRASPSRRWGGRTRRRPARKLSSIMGRAAARGLTLRVVNLMLPWMDAMDHSCVRLYFERDGPPPLGCYYAIEDSRWTPNGLRLRLKRRARGGHGDRSVKFTGAVDQSPRASFPNASPSLDSSPAPPSPS